MAVYLKPCNGCPIREGCEQRAVFRQKVSGLGLRSATFNCDKIKAALAPGVRIVVAHPILDTNGEYGDYRIAHEHFPATIVSSNGYEFSCVIDREPLAECLVAHGDEDTSPDKVRFRRTMKHRRIVRFLDEPRRTFCKGGGRLQLPSGGCDKRPDEDCVCVIFSHHINETEAA